MLSAASEKQRLNTNDWWPFLAKRGGTPSEGKTLLAEMLAFTPLSAQIGQGAAEKILKHLMVTFIAAAAEMAMYESLRPQDRSAIQRRWFHLRVLFRTKSAMITTRSGPLYEQVPQIHLRLSWRKLRQQKMY
ncbi:MAG: hypothetical protein JWQ42_4000 [Edaphobacter sp.]|nr:hypothetical protein [Edaphobacter sp.]